MLTEISDEIYLTPELNEYYKNDFTNNVLTEKRDSWKLSPKIVDYLVQLNDSEKLKPLYSMYPDDKHSVEKDVSYLKFAYVKEIEQKLFKLIIPVLMVKLNESKYPDTGLFRYVFYYPKYNKQAEGESKFKMGCLTNTEYFRVNHFYFEYKSESIKTHNKFWKEVTEYLTAL